MPMTDQALIFETVIYIPSREKVNECCNNSDMNEIESNENIQKTEYPRHWLKKYNPELMLEPKREVNDPFNSTRH